MTSIGRTIYALVCCLVLLSCVASFAAVPIRGSSKNGDTDLSANWNVFGPTALDVRHKGDLTLRTQILCTNQDFVNATNPADFENTGTCAGGNYTFLFQLQSTVAGLKVSLANLVGFTPSSDEDNQGGFGSWGILGCEDSNTGELCSNVTDASTDDLTKLANITAVITKKNNRITFTIPEFPQFPAGIDREGQGLTLVVVTQQTPGQPVAVPKIDVVFPK